MKTYIFRTATKCALAIIWLSITGMSTPAQTNTFPSSGNAGVGTTAPVTKVHAMSANTTSSSVIATTDSSGNSGSGLALWSGWSGGGPNQPALIWTSGRDLRFGGGITDLATGIGFSETMRITSGGRVGIGTATPDTWAKLHVYNADGAGIDIQSANAGQWSRIRLVTGTRIYGWFAGDASNGLAPNMIGLYDYTANAFRMMVDSSGRVGIGTSTPQSNLQIGAQTSASTATPSTLSLGGSYSSTAGANLKLKLYDDGTVANTYGIGVSVLSMDFGVSSTAGYHWYAGGTNKMTLTNNGDLSVSGNISAKYQDLAEWVPSSEQLPAGTVVVLDSTKSNHVIASTQAYDDRVAGVISLQPGLTLGEKGEGHVLVATTGRVKVKVDTSNGPIQIGDLLVTSDKPGMATKSIRVEVGGVRIHRPGTLIGKALESLSSGEGEILVLLSLQ